MYTQGALFLIICCITSFAPSLGDVSGGYKLSSIIKRNDGSIVAILDTIKSSNLYGPDILQLQVTISYEDQDRLHVHITDYEESYKRWEVPLELIPRSKAPGSSHYVFDDASEANAVGERGSSSHQLQFSYTSEPFGFAITRNSNKEVLFNSTPGSSHSFGSMVFKDQYLEISTSLPKSASIYGFGESTRPDGFRLAPGRLYTLWATDIASANPNVDLYGSYPFYLDMRSGGLAHGVFLLNSNGMDISYQGESITYKVLGGVLDFYFFPGPSPLSVVQQLTQLVGRPAPMPYWSLGFQQSKYGYKSVSELEYVVSNYANARIPLEVIWSDIDHMDKFKDFTLDPLNYPADKMKSFLEKVHADGQHFVLIIDPGIKTESNYSTYQNGLEAGIYIKDSSGNPYLGQVWPGPVNFPDFFHPKAQSFWTSEISKFHETVAFDGLWIDMNEISNFCSGITCTLPANNSCPRADAPTQCCLICDSTHTTKWDDPPYSINKLGSHKDLWALTTATSATHFNGILEYNAHNLYGFSEAIATNRALECVLKKRPFVLSRSTFIGSGRYTAHWTGDNAATWNDIGYSIVGILNAGLVGIPMAGADICGFLSDTTEELCNRWIQLGAFYPFARDHSTYDSKRQELYLWESVAQSARKALGLRYRLLPHLYTLVFEAHILGSPIARPLFFQFPSDPITLGIDSQFMLGTGILVSPVLSAGATSVKAYFPKGSWYNLFNYSQVVNAGKGSYQVLSAPLDTINVHVHEGSIILLQEEAQTTAEARKTPFTLLVAFPLQSSKANNPEPDIATGELFLDNGDDVEMAIVAGKSTFLKYRAFTLNTSGFIGARVIHGEFALQQGLVLQKVVILGMKAPPNNLKINNKAASPIKCSYQVSSSHVEISGLSLPVGKDFKISWSKMLI
ncbi:hypothetical protein O6H91_10G102400 [Diphasiastrum complanatum]|uniref:Uncharacterized protein n=2 Tax=Diphasiastrum complanatum TaxID=34168 RepID=A0ACC2CK18_DIPCM|nr:hypothetical protein O6H91_Y361800 [Diphasiastrum complanatum]KAJ7297181.1 hypothetical protein O6H91_Y074900 [Diphasiastrum complanatum]KAJ7542355.1 hypothetical protein O6H91_10G102400 [Diphasiastrum complanatum]